MKVTVEVCVASVEGAIAAEAAGADRIELNCALELDGLSPPAGLFERVRSSVSLPIIAMARPRSGDFAYTTDQWATLLADAKWLLASGADGIAFGCVSGGVLELDRCREMRDLAAGKELVFHKAFDALTDWRVGLESLAAIGIDRVMTSGGLADASEAATEIGEMVGVCRELAHSGSEGSAIEVIPAGGVTSDNVGRLVEVSGVSQVHGSFSRGILDGDRMGLESEIRRVLLAVN